jgi:hypothetical protein
MATISEAELNRIVDGIVLDRDLIIKHNPIGSDAEVLLWMLLSCLVSYLSLTDSDVPCFPGRADANVYGDAVRLILKARRTGDFDVEPYLAKLSGE